MTFLWVLLAHLLYDFHWQNDFIAQYKGKRVFILMVHALTWAVFISLVLYLTGIFLWWKLVFLFITHCLIDKWKCQLPKTDDYFWGIYVDQGLHSLTLILVTFM